MQVGTSKNPLYGFAREQSAESHVSCNERLGLPALALRCPGGGCYSASLESTVLDAGTTLGISGHVVFGTRWDAFGKMHVTVGE